MNKLFLKEEEEIISKEDYEVETETGSGDVLIISNLINSMIKGEWDAIDLYNGSIGAIESLGDEYKDMIDIIKEIIHDEYIHVGQLESMLQRLAPISNNIKEGEKENNEIVNGD